MNSSFGEKLKVTIKGGSHEPSVSVSIKGLPKGFEPDMAALQEFLDRRAPGKSALTSSRCEPDIPILISSDDTCFEFEIANTDIHPSDYEKYKNIPRPGHADYTAHLRYGDSLDMSGGGPFSGRMTAPLCVAGGLALQVLNARGIKIESKLIIGGISDNNKTSIEAVIADAKASGDSIGGIVECTATGVPGGIGDVMYGGLESRLSKILFGIPAVKGLEFGAGFQVSKMKGSENNDAFYYEAGQVKTRTNNCGGILGGISTGMPVFLRVAFKPTPSIQIPQESVNLATGEAAVIRIEGRHDPCVAVRGVPAVEAAVALGLLDAILVTEDARNIPAGSSLTGLREEIDEIDSSLIALFRRRMNIAKQIGKIKKSKGLPIEDATRENEILDEISSQISSSASSDLEPLAKAFFLNLFSLSRACQVPNGTYGLIGNPLPHSFSKEIHEAFGEYGFNLYDLSPAEMESFISRRNFQGLSVTRPYKQDVIKFCDKLTDRAKEIGAVNTLYWEDGDILVGHNTDYDGFLYTANLSHIDFAGKTALILGTGGTAKTVSKVLRDEGAKAIYMASRSGDRSPVFSYENLHEISEEIDIIINTTPVGTYPDNLSRLISVRDFPNCTGVIDVVYNPQRTPLIMEAESLGIKTAGGMPMIVAQAAYAAERFLGKPGFFTKKIPEILSETASKKANIVLIGMPGCGKTTIGKLIAELSNKSFVDLDNAIEEKEGRTIPEILTEMGEEFFRNEESLAAAKYGREHGQVIATGGGVVLTPENYEALHQNGTIIWLMRPAAELPIEGRPLSQGADAINIISKERTPVYKKWADFALDSGALLKLLISMYQ